MKKGIYSAILAVTLTAAVFALPIINSGSQPTDDNSGSITRAPHKINNTKENSSSDTEVKLPKSDETVTFIITVKGDPLSKSVLQSGGKYTDVSQLLRSGDARSFTDAVKKSQAVVKASIKRMIPEASVDGGYTYSSVINGFSVTAPYSSLEKLKNISGVTSVELSSNQIITISENDEKTDEEVYGFSDPEDTTDDEDIQTGDEDASENEDQTVDEDTDESEDQTGDESSQDESTSSEDGESQTDETSGESSADKTEKKDQDIDSNSYHLHPVNDMTGAPAAYKSNYTGKGMVIAVIDNGFNSSHQAFSVDPPSVRYSSGDISTLTKTGIFNISSSANKSAKIVFAYDYAENDNITFNRDSSHGTHIAASIAGNNGETGKNAFRGQAYDSQLAFLKVVKDGENKSSDAALLAALDDASKLSPDVLNISLGVPRTGSNSKLFSGALKSLSQLGTYIIASAGNSSKNVSTPDGKGISADYTDYGTISYPASLEAVTAVGSADTKVCLSPYFTTDTGTRIEMRKILADNDDYPDFEEKEKEYVYLEGSGIQEDYAGKSVKDKIVIINRGEMSFGDKAKIAAANGAAGMLILSDEPLYIRFSAETLTIPCGVISGENKSFFTDSPKGTLKYSHCGEYTSPTGGNPSAFTSYGVTSDLRLKPDILAPGTEVYSALNSEYGTLSGSSCSASLLSGEAGIISQFISEKGLSSSDKGRVISALLMNTAVPAVYEGKTYYTPRIQGAGIVNTEKAISTSAYVTDNNLYSSSSLGENEKGSYNTSLTLTSISDKDTVYKLSSSIQTDKLYKTEGKVYNTLTPEDISGYAEISYKVDNKPVSSVTLKAGKSVNISVEIQLSPEAVIYYQKMASNGFFVDGYFFLTPSDNSSVLSVPFTGYCGKWADSDIFDVSAYDSDCEPAIGRNSLVAVEAVGGTYPGVTLGKNMTTSEFSGDNVCFGRNTVKNAYDLSNDERIFILPNYYLLRDASEYTISISDSFGKSIYSQNAGTVSAFAGGGYEPYIGLIAGFNTDGMKNFFTTLQDGKYYYTVSASVSTSKNNPDPQSVTTPVIVDNTAPSDTSSRTYSKDGRVYLELKAKDTNGVQGFILYTAVDNGGTMSYSDRLDDLIEGGYIRENCYSIVKSSFTENSACVTYDITDLYCELIRLQTRGGQESIMASAEYIFFRAADYAYNLSSPTPADPTIRGTVSYTLTDDNGRPVQGARMSLGDRTAESDEKGNVVFERVIPDMYGASLIYIPENYKTDFKSEFLKTSISSPDHKGKINFRYTGEKIIEESSRTSSEITDNTEKDTNKKTQAKTEKPDSYSKSSTFALIFVSVLLLICTLSVAVNRISRRRR